MGDRAINNISTKIFKVIDYAESLVDYRRAKIFFRHL